MLVTIWTHWEGKTWVGDVPGLEGLTENDANERIFRLFNRVTDADCDRLEEWGYLLPSLSVLDEVAYNGSTFRVAPVGFERVK